MKPEYLRPWTLPECYHGSHWDGYYAFLGQSRDSDCLERCNFEVGLAAVKAVASNESIPNDPDDSATVQVVRESHWAVGWVEWIAIHESDESALTEADRFMERLEDYPILDEERLSEMEREEANDVWRDCFRIKERIDYIRKHRGQFEFHDMAEMLSVARGKYFIGYASELLN